MADTPKCKHCDGMGFEPQVYPMALCTACKGSGKPPPKETAPAGAA